MRQQGCTVHVGGNIGGINPESILHGYTSEKEYRIEFSPHSSEDWLSSEADERISKDIKSMHQRFQLI